MAAPDRSHLSKIDPELEELLRNMPPSPVGMGDDLPTMRATLLERKRKLTEAMLKDAKGVEKNDMTVPARDGYKIPIRTYRPEGSTEGRPLVIFMHGGGFCLGGLENEELLCHRFAERNGVVAINVDYRLAPENQFPAAPQDAWDVTKWISANASTLGADLSKGFIVGGVSAGANLAAVVAHLARDEQLSTPVTGSLLQVPLVLSMDCIEDRYKPELKSHEENAEAPVLNAQTVKMLMENYQPDVNSHLFNLFAPPTNFSNLPPTFFQVAGMDPLRDNGLLYERVLREEYNTKTNLQIYPGLPHSFWTFFTELKASKKVIEDAIAGLDWLLKERS